MNYDVTYLCVLEAFHSATGDVIKFRGRDRSMRELRNMLLSLVVTGINRHLELLVEKLGKEVAKMSLHCFCFAGSAAFNWEGLDVRFLPHQDEIDEIETGLEKAPEKVLAIKYKNRPRTTAELPKNKHGRPLPLAHKCVGSA